MEPNGTSIMLNVEKLASDVDLLLGCLHSDEDRADEMRDYICNIHQIVFPEAWKSREV